MSGSGYGTFYTGASSTSSTDLAEYYLTKDQTISAGDVVILSREGLLEKAGKSYDPNLIGIISTKPGVLMGSVDGDPQQGEKRMLALAGRVPVKIAPDSKPIAVGDYLTSSDTYPGMAMKATGAGYIVGTALESWKKGTATIDAFVQLGWRDPDWSFDNNGNFILTSDKPGEYLVKRSNGSLVEKVAGFARAVIGRLEVGKLFVSGTDVLERFKSQDKKIEELENRIKKLELKIKN